MIIHFVSGLLQIYSFNQKYFSYNSFPYFSKNVDSKSKLQENFLYIFKLIFILLVISFTLSLLFYDDVINFFLGINGMGLSFLLIPLM